MSDPFGSKSLLDALCPILKLRWFSGRSISWPSTDYPRRLRWVQIIKDMVITVLTLSYAIYCVHFFFETDFNMGQLLIGMLLTFSYVGPSLLSVITLILRFTSDRDLIKELQAYRMISGYDGMARLKKTNFQLLWGFLILILAAVSLSSTLFLTSIFPKESVLVRILMFSHHDGLKFTVGVISFAIVSFFIGTGQVSDFWILAFFIQIIRREFRFLRSKWLQTQSENSTGSGHYWHEEIDVFRREYEQVIGLIKAVDRTFRFDLLLYFGVLVPVICVFIYAVLQSKDIESADLYIILFMTCVIIAQSGLIIFIGVNVSSFAHELTDDLYNVDMTNIPSDVISKLSIFLTRLTASPIGISVAGLFVIDSSTILMLAGTLLTYVVVVIQTKPSNNQYYLHEQENCTLT